MSSERFSMNVQTLTKTDFKLLYISTSKYEGEWQSLPHTHHFTELFYVIHGRGSFLVEQDQFQVEENDLVIVNPSTSHTEQSYENEPLEYIVCGVEGLTFEFDVVHMEKNYGLFCQLPDKHRLLQFFSILLKEISEKQVGYELICHDILEVILIMLTRARKLALISVPAARISKECAMAKRYMDTNYYEDITLDFLAAFTHTNKYYLAHSFTSCLGMSPIQYLTDKRLTVCRELLSSTDYSISQITSCVGFSSQSYLSQIFKKHTGLSPQQYRKTYKNI